MKKNNEELNKSNTLTTMVYSDLASHFLKVNSLKELAIKMRSVSNEFLYRERNEELKRLIEHKKKKNAQVIQDAGIGRDYFYAVYRGKRNPSRGKTIQLCFGIGLDGNEANLFLKHMGHNELYLRDERDVIIFTALTKGHSLVETEDFLFANGYETITKY